MRRRLLAAAILAVACVALIAGYYLSQQEAGVAAFLQHSEGPDWPDRPVSVGIAVWGTPMFSESEGQFSGLFADLFREVPMNGRPWTITRLDADDASLAVRTQSLDYALLARTDGQDLEGLSLSLPLVTSRLAFFSVDTSPREPSFEGQLVSWYGPDGCHHLLLRLGAEPIKAASAQDCLTKAASREVHACLIDEDMGLANAAQAGLASDLRLVGPSPGAVEYLLVCRSGNRWATEAMQSWVTEVTTKGTLEALRREWLGSPIASGPASSYRTPFLVTLCLCLLSIGAAGILAAKNHALMRASRGQVAQQSDSDEKYRALFESANDAIFILAPGHWRIVDANRRAEELTGYDREELARMRFGQLLPARYGRALHQWLLHDLERGRIEEMPLIRSDGSIATVEISSKIISNSTRDVCFCIVRNITVKKQMQRQLERTARFSQTILEHMTNPVLTVDPDGYITSHNRASEEILVPANGEVENRHIDDVVRAQVQKLGDLVRKTVDSNAPTRATLDVVDSAGNDVTCRVVVSPMSEGGPVSGALLIFTDTDQTATVRGEHDRLATLSMLGQMSGVLAHDIRDRVTGIHVGVQYLAEKLAPDDPRKQSMEVIRTETERTVQIIDDILMLLRPGELEKAPCRPADLVERVMRSYAAIAQKQKVELIAEVAPNMPIMSADVIKLERALGNLVKNAIQAMQDGGRVKLAADTVSENGSSERLKVRFRISDDGPGIPAEVRARMFEPFVSRRRGPGGIGLGLYITKRIIDDHKGSIKVESRPNKGTSFTIVLPIGPQRRS